MAITEETTLRIVLYEGENAEALSAEERCASLTALLEKGYSVTCAGNGTGHDPSLQQLHHGLG